MSPDDRPQTLLILEIPRTNDKKELSAEQMFAALHGILRPKRELWKDGTRGQEHVSFEIASIGQRIRFYVWLPKPLQAFVEGQIYAQYPTAQIHEAPEDYAQRQLSQSVIYTSELVLTDHEALPIKSFPSFEVDPLAAITATFSKLDQPNEEMWVQFILRPINDDWHKRSGRVAARIREGRGSNLSNAGLASLTYVGQAIGTLFKPATDGAAAKAYEMTERDKTRVTAIEEKSRKLGYQVKVRILYAGNDQTTARLRMQAMVGTFKQFNTTNLNGFQSKYASFDPGRRSDYALRSFSDKGYILNIEEVASLFHLPHTSVETPNIVWATTKTSEPPSSLPAYGQHPEESLSLFGVTNFRGSNIMFGALRADRGRHLYILGQTGTGKSGLLELLTLSDIYYDQGFAVIDPHGDYATSVLRYVPERRIKDVIYFNPADHDFPVAFNPLEITDSATKGQVSSELVGVLKRMFDSWGPRLEYILRFTILALLDYPNSTMLDITRMLTEKKFRDDVVRYVDDPVVKNFWVTEFASWNEKFASEAVAPVLNKVGAFTANPLVRNIIGQPKSAVSIRRAMDEGKIIIINLSKGLIGEDNAAILGSMFVTKIQLAAMSRSDIPRIEDRRPFYLYVDEFQNFATDSFAVILSEARKYGLNLTIANQYISQMEESVRNAVFGNVGSMITFRVSPDDSPFLIKYYEPQFEAADLSNMHNRHFVTSMSIAGEKVAPFSGTTLNIPPAQQDHSADIIAWSRQSYASPRDTVEAQIRQATLGSATAAPIAAPQPNGPHVASASAAVHAVVAPPTAQQQTYIPTEPPKEKLSESAKRRLRRKRAAAQQQNDTPPQVSATAAPTVASNGADTPVTPPEVSPHSEPTPRPTPPPVSRPLTPPEDPTELRLR